MIPPKIIVAPKQHVKVLYSPEYNYVFSMKTGCFARWGKTPEDDPQCSPYGPEIADIEISTVCRRGCKWCYKGNTATGKNMSIDTFSRILDKLPPSLTQVALGIGDVDACPDLFLILSCCRDRGIVPNITINGSRMTGEIAGRLARLCGAVAVSHYDDDECFKAIDMLASHGLKQINIHQLMSEETFAECMHLVNLKALVDPRMKNVNAIVFLSLKNKGRGSTMHRASDVHFGSLVRWAMQVDMSIGFDSCTAHRFLSVLDKDTLKKVEQSVEPCESSCFSIYINVDGKAYPCSFLEGNVEPVDVISSSNFIADVWNAKPIVDFRASLLANNRKCPAYEI